MFQYDLTLTPLAASPARVRVPSEPELMAILVAMMIRHDRAPSELSALQLVFGASDEEQVARIIEERLAPFARDLGSGEHLRERLRWLVGMRIVVD